MKKLHNIGCAAFFVQEKRWKMPSVYEKTTIVAELV